MAKRKPKYVYFFGGGKSEGKASMKELLGGKGANLAEMSSLGLPVPAGFTITTETCDAYYKLGRKYPAELEPQIDANIRKLEKVTGKTFGKGKNPLLVSVRSGAAVSMPGMMDTVLNLGLNDVTIQAMIENSGNERFVWDSYGVQERIQESQEVVPPRRTSAASARRRRGLQLVEQHPRDQVPSA